MPHIVTEFLIDVLTKDKNVLIMGDINIHINNQEDQDACTFSEIMEALGLIQHVTFPTLKAGNILDHIYTEANGNVRVDKCMNRYFISDQCLCVLRIPKENITKKTVTYRKFSNVDRYILGNQLHFDLEEFDNANDLVKQFHEKVKLCIEQQAPEKTRTVTLRRQNLWFTQKVQEQKCVVRRREKILETL